MNLITDIDLIYSLFALLTSDSTSIYSNTNHAKLKLNSEISNYPKPRSFESFLIRIKDLNDFIQLYSTLKTELKHENIDHDFNTYLFAKEFKGIEIFHLLNCNSYETLNKAIIISKNIKKEYCDFFLNASIIDSLDNNINFSELSIILNCVIECIVTFYKDNIIGRTTIKEKLTLVRHLTTHSFASIINIYNCLPPIVKLDDKTTKGKLRYIYKHIK